MNKHTSGPWKLSHTTAKGKQHISGAGWGKFASVYVVNAGENDPEGEANAILIKNAPELLDALEEAANALDAFGHHQERNAARAVIAKARGE